MSMILRLDITGTPTAWLSKEEAALLYSKSLVKWEFGKALTVLTGGVNKLGIRSTLEMSPVIAIAGNVRPKRRQSFTNTMLFRRDNYRCMYCGQIFNRAELTRDHVTPRSRGGKDIWENVVAACKRCNHTKSNRTPEEAGMELLAVPFRPNVFESMYLAQHTILADQMEYLEKQFSGKREWKAA